MQMCTGAFQANMHADPDRLRSSVASYKATIDQLLRGQAEGSRAADFKAPLASWQSFLNRYQNGQGNLDQAFVFLQQANRLVQNIH